MDRLKWPERWQAEAIGAARPYLESDERLDVLVGDPAASISGTLYQGHLFRGADDAVMIIHDRSGRPDVYPWRLPLGPVLVLKLLRPRKRAVELFRNPEWTR